MKSVGLALLFPFLLTPIVSFLFRMVNATIAPELIAEFNLGPAELGLITSAYFIGFGLTQLPMGVLLDRYGPRVVVIGLQLVGATGGALFVVADGQMGLLIGRFLIGVGMAGSVMAGLKAANLWFERERLPAINALLFGMTGLGGMLATGPLAQLLKVIDWRTAMLMICVYCCAIAMISAMMIPRVVQTGPAPRLLRQIADIGRLYKSATFLRFAPVTVASIAGYSSYQSLWAAIWLRDLEGFSRDAQAWALFMLMGAMMIGNFAFGAINSQLRARGISTLNAALTAMALMALLQAVIVLDIVAASLPIWILMALCTSGPVAMYAVLSQRFPPELAGRTNTAINVLAFLGGFLVQSGIGFLLAQFPVSADGGYDPVGHRLALAIVVAIQVAAFAWFFFSARLDRSSPAVP